MLNHRTNKDGRHTLIFQVLHRRRRGVIFSPYRLDAAEFDAVKGMAKAVGSSSVRRKTIREINGYIASQTQELLSSISEITLQEPDFTVQELVDYHRRRLDKQRIDSFAASLIADMEAGGKYGTAATYRATMNIFRRFAGEYSYRFDELTDELLFRFERFLNMIKLKRNTVTFYMRVLRAIYNKAVRAGYASASASPFREISFREEKTRKLALSQEVLKRLAEWDFGSKSHLAEARDLFLFSFYARGMSFVDMAYLRRDEIVDGVIRYHRHKTGQLLGVKILPALQALIDRYRGDSPWVLPILQAPDTVHGDEGEDDELMLHRQYKAALNKYLFSLSIISRILKINGKVTFNAARHTWASFARTRGIPVGVISESLGHTSEKTTHIYLDALDPELVDRANEIVTVF